MRFLCENCKAKYQIPDEKLAGRAVHMKCRKCGNSIEVPSPESALSSAPAAAVAPNAPPTTSSSAAAPVRVAAHSPGAVARPAAPPPPSATARAAARPAPAPAKPASALHTGLAGAFDKVAHNDVSVSAAIEVLSAGAAEEWYVGVNGVPLGPVRLSVLRQKAQQGTINEDSLVWREGFDEWLPLRTFPELVVLVHEAREQAVRGSLTPSPPQVQRQSAIPSPPVRVAPARPAPPRPAAPFGPSSVARPVAPAPSAMRPAIAAPLSPSPFALGEISSALGAEAATVALGAPVAPIAFTPAPYSARIDGASSPTSAAVFAAEVMADPFAGPPAAAPMSSSAPARLPAAPLVPNVLGPIAISDRSSALPDGAARASLVDELAIGVRRQVRMHPAAYAFIALAFGFGVTAAVVVVFKPGQPGPPATVQVVVTAPPTQQQGGAPVPGGAVSISENMVVGDPGRRTGPSGSGSRSDRDPKDTSASSPMPNVGLGDLGGPSGPSVTGPKPGGGDNSNLPQLGEGDIQRVVSSNVGFVKRQCWEPALSSRSPSAPSTAKVTVMVTIGADGSVQSAHASGGSGYPTLASCVESRVRGWKFPPSSGTSTANVPFVFASQ